MKRIFLIGAFLLSAATAHAQSPTTTCNSSNLNAAYSDNVNNVQYMCTAIGWKQNIGIGNPVVACAPKNYGQNYTDVSTPATFQCGEAGWFSITGGGGGAPGGSNQDVQFNSTGVFGGDPTFTFNTSTKFLGVQNEFVNPLGSAITGTNYGSGQLEFSGSYCTGGPCNPAFDEWDFQSYMGTGVNPTSELLINHSGTPGNSFVQFGSPVTLPTGSTSVTQTVGDNSTKNATDAFVLANSIGSSSIPATSNLLKGSGTAGSSSPASPGNDYVTPNAANGMNPTQTATSGNNYPSNQFILQGSYWTGSAATGDFFIQQDVPSSGSNNPVMLHEFIHSGSSGGAQGQFNYPLGANYGFSGPIIDAQFFGAYGDAYSRPDGCTTTASNTTITCRDNPPFVSADVGKQIWVQGAGAAGVAFHGQIVTVTDATHVVVTPAPSTSVAYGPLNNVYGHDDVAAVQNCLNYASTNAVTCFLRAAPPPNGGISNTGNTGFLIGSGGLQLVGNYLGAGSSFMGSGPVGTGLFCEYNGDCLSLGAGPIVGSIVSNIFFLGDPTQPSARGIHLNAAAGSGGTGGLWDSTFSNLQVQNFALECMLSEGGGGAGYGYNLPIQIDTFSQFECNGPNQSHPANLIKMTGQHAQIIFQNGQANGNGPNAGNNSWTYYPNPLIDIDEKTSGLSDAPEDVKFYGYTAEVGTQGIYLGQGSTNIHFDNSYIENVGTPLIAYDSAEMTFSGNHIANSGNITGVSQFTGLVTGGMRDNLEYGGLVTVTTLAACSGSGNTVDFAGNQINGSSVGSTNCATSTATPSSSTLTVTGGQTVSVGTPSTTITTIAATGINPGKTLTLYASGTGILLGTGGNINLGPYTSPLGVPSGGTITLTLFDQGSTWTVTGVTPAPVVACTAPTMTYRWTPTAGCSTSTPCATDQVAGNNASQTTSGDLPTYSATGGPNGTPALTFNGSTDFITPTTAIASGLTTFTMYAIFKPAGTPSGHNYALFGGATNGIELGISDAGDVAFLNQESVAGVTGTKTFPASTWYTEVATYNNGTTTVNLYATNGGALISDGGPQVQALTFSSTTPDLGAAPVISDYFNGSIAEWGFLSGTASPAGIAQWSSCHYGT